ncbi:MAG: PrsW family glutamic-type intramembrane protease [Candidatus Bathyarchaeia archaeon]|jgi:hypothetical protein
MTSQSGSQTLSPLIPEILCLVGGIIAAIIIILPLETALNPPGILVGVIEEPAKLIAVIYLAFKFPESLSSKRRGLILGGLAGLGYAFTENLIYVLRPTDYQCLYYDLNGQCVSFLPVMLSGTDIIGRAILSAPGHVMFSGIAALGLVYLAQKRIDLSKTTPTAVVSHFASKNVGSFLLLAIILHGLWDALPAGPIIMFFVTLFVYYRLWKILPENLQDYEIPGFIGLVVAIFSSRKPLTIKPSQQTTIAQTQNKFCINCGKKILPQEKFCKHCGTAQQ